MRKTFDRRVVPDYVLDFVRSCQQRVPCHLGGGAALAGVYLSHRTTGDIDLFVHDSQGMRSLVGLLPGVAADSGTAITLLRDVGHLARAQVEAQDGDSVEIDIVHEPVADIEAPPPPVEGIVVESLPDLRASKLTCILSRSEPAIWWTSISSIRPDFLPNEISRSRRAKTPVLIRLSWPGSSPNFQFGPCP
jgi:Nucleotidyl transferase AbiEii toxin, Type IV TA system